MVIIFVQFYSHFLGRGSVNFLLGCIARSPLFLFLCFFAFVLILNLSLSLACAWWWRPSVVLEAWREARDD